MEPQLQMLLRYVFAISDASQALSVAPLREGRACGSVQSELIIFPLTAGIDGGALAIPRCPL